MPTIQLMLENESMADFIELALHARHYVVRRADDSWKGQARPNPPDIAVFDLPSTNPGRLQQISVLRTWLGNPLSLCITSCRNRETLAALIRLGIEEFVFEPFGFPELEQRFDLLLCRRLVVGGGQGYPFVERRRNSRPSMPADAAGRATSTPGFQLNVATKSVFIDGAEIRLSPREYQLLHVLAQEPGRVFTTDEIIRAVWPAGSRAGTADVHQYMHMVRRKIEQSPDQPRWIRNVKGFGYVLSL